MTAGARSGRTPVSGAYALGTATSTFATRPIEVKTYPAERSSGSQSTPSTVISVEVGVKAGGVGTPQRSVMGGSPQAVVVGESGSVLRRTAVKTELGKAESRSAHAALSAGSVGLGAGTATGPAQPTRTLQHRAVATVTVRYTRMTLTLTTKGARANMSEISRTAAVSEVGEHVLIAELKARLGDSQDALVGIGDDAAVIGLSESRVVISTDVLVQDRHFRLNWSTANDIGRRVAGANLADVAAMGAMPKSLVVGLVLPPETQVGWVLDFLDGLAAGCEEIGASVVGGDLAAGEKIMISATALGDMQGREPVTRNGARPGDVVAVAGRLGWAGAGLSMLSRGFTSPRVLVDAHRVPKPPYLAGVHAASAGAHAMLDVSDGLVTDLGHIATASGVSIDIEADSIAVDDPIRDAASAFNADPLTWILAGGDDHAIAATFAADTQIPIGFRVIGRVQQADMVGPQVTVDGVLRPDLRGFDHFI